MWDFHTKLKMDFHTLSVLYRREYGDIYAAVKKYKEKVKIAKNAIVSNNTKTNRSKLKYVTAKYI